MTPTTASSVLGHEVARVSPRRAQTRERLMAAATAVFAERGIIGASVEEICEAAGFTRGAFYSNFADKDALVLALIEAGIAAQYAAAEQAIADLADIPRDASPEELLSLALTRFDSRSRNAGPGHDAREGVLIEQELMLHAARVPALRAPYAAFVDACNAQLTGLISDALVTVGLEFVVPLDQAIDMLSAAHRHTQISSLFLGEAAAPTLERLVLAITRATNTEAGTRER